jgi:hypothetical protein
MSLTPSGDVLDARAAVSSLVCAAAPAAGNAEAQSAATNARRDTEAAIVFPSWLAGDLTPPSLPDY